MGTLRNLRTPAVLGRRISMALGLERGGFGNIAAKAKMVSRNSSIVSWDGQGRNNWDEIGRAALI
jgi:hypothetical protein